MIEFPGSEVIYRAATGLERSEADVDAERLMSIPAEIIISNWDPFQTTNLRHVAYAYGVRLWEDIWNDDVKRRWVANQWTFKAKVGTLEAFDMALAPSGYRVVQAITPPQAFYASPNMSKEEWDAWMREMPQIRIKLAERTGEQPGDVWFAGDGCVGLSGAFINFGPEIYGRKAVIRYPDGHEVDMRVSTITDTTELLTAVNREQLHIPGQSTQGFFVDDFAGEMFVDAEEVEAQIVSVALDRTYWHTTSTLALTSVVPGLEPMDVRYERNSDIGDASLWCFVGDFAGAGECFAEQNVAPDMLADRVYLHDPSVAVPMTLGLSFAGVDRVGIPPHTMELLIDLGTKEVGSEWFAGDSFVSDRFALPQDTTHMERSLRAVVAAKSLRDTVLVRWDVQRSLNLGDRVAGDAVLLDPVPTEL